MTQHLTGTRLPPVFFLVFSACFRFSVFCWFLAAFSNISIAAHLILPSTPQASHSHSQEELCLVACSLGYVVVIARQTLPRCFSLWPCFLCAGSAHISLRPRRPRYLCFFLFHAAHFLHRSGRSPYAPSKRLRHDLEVVTVDEGVRRHGDAILWGAPNQEPRLEWGVPRLLDRS